MKKEKKYRVRFEIEGEQVHTAQVSSQVCVFK